MDEVHLKCRCGHPETLPEELFLEQDIYTCAGCGRAFNLDEDTDADLEIEYPERKIFWYLAPMLICQCRAMIELPYSNLPQTDSDAKILLRGEDPPELPSEDWSAIFGCRECGRVSTYFDPEVIVVPIHKLTEGIHHSGKGVYAVKFPCGDRHCTVPASFHVDIGDGNASEVVALLRSGLFDERRLPCGHVIKTVPVKFYQVEPVLRRMW